MAQRRNKTDSHYQTTLSAVVQVKPRRKRPRNDNVKTRYSGMNFRAAKKLQRRTEDIDWQIRFARMKLHHWHDVDNWNWDALNALLERAKTAHKQLG